MIGDALLFMSEHEGFGVPLVEGMNMDVPVIAHAAATVPEVLGDAGVLFKTKGWPLMAETIALVSSHPSSRELVLTRQRERREVFAARRVARQWRRLSEQAM